MRVLTIDSTTNRLSRSKDLVSADDEGLSCQLSQTDDHSVAHDHGHDHLPHVHPPHDHPADPNSHVHDPEPDQPDSDQQNCCNACGSIENTSCCNNCCRGRKNCCGGGGSIARQVISMVLGAEASSAQREDAATGGKVISGMPYWPRPSE